MQPHTKPPTDRAGKVIKVGAEVQVFTNEQPAFRAVVKSINHNGSYFFIGLTLPDHNNVEARRPPEQLLITKQPKRTR